MLCVRSKSTPRAARTDLTRFSTACWAWNPTTSSGTSGFSTRPASAASSPAAFPARTRARSGPSRFGKHPSFRQGVMEHRPLHVAPCLDLGFADDDDVRWDPEVGGESRKSHAVVEPVMDFALDDQQVHVAVVSPRPACA